jgi:hypothetical protein
MIIFDFFFKRPAGKELIRRGTSRKKLTHISLSHRAPTKAPFWQIRGAANRGAAKNYKHLPPPSEENASIPSSLFGQPLKSSSSRSPPVQISVRSLRGKLSSSSRSPPVQIRPDSSSWLLPIPGAAPTRARTPQAPSRPELACGGAAALPDASSPPLASFPSSPGCRGCLDEGSQREIWGVGNQLGDLGNTTCTEKNKNIGAARPNEDVARRTFTAPRGMVEWQREAESTEFREAGLFPNTP